ncbi:MAG: Gfo/Idh/MocA family oxidoreductase [Candidatus Anammoximicrobium sp.]|nr:Gfo/Idh/MocA family oxidoreductase [Candidatus Anammoximicrobium sp.]
MTRRRFLAAAARAGAVLAVPAFVPASALGKDGGVAASERITLGGIGLNGRGTYVLKALLTLPDTVFVAVCDVRADRRKAVKELVDAKYGNQDCGTYRDLRELLARRDIDAVLIATGDRWHTLASIMAAKAGKDVYCEKPCSMSIGESRILAETMRRYGRVFQVGTQRRTIDSFKFAADLARSGKLGKLQTLHASLAFYGGGPNGEHVRHDWLPAEPEPPRETLDWDLWLGPAPWRPYNRAYSAGTMGWLSHFDFNAGGGWLNWASHTVDLCQWANQADGTTPIEFEPVGPERGYAAKQVVQARYANGVKLVMRPCDDKDWLPLGSCQVRFEGEEGWVETGDSNEVAVYPETLRTERTVFDKVGTFPVSHLRNFVDCVKSRAQPATNADVARSSHVASHAAAIAWMLDRRLTFDPATESFLGDDEANRMRTRAMREPWQM